MSRQRVAIFVIACSMLAFQAGFQVSRRHVRSLLVSADELRVSFEGLIASFEKLHAAFRKSQENYKACMDSKQPAPVAEPRPGGKI